jgi:hypothetical protein
MVRVLPAPTLTGAQPCAPTDGSVAAIGRRNGNGAGARGSAAGRRLWRTDRPTEPEHWARAFDLWLSEKAPNTRRAYLRAWEDLLQFAGVPPARIRSGDVQDWAEDLAARALDLKLFVFTDAGQYLLV